MTSPYVIQVRKEVRALLPWWMGVALTTTVTAIMARGHERDDLIAVVHALGILAVAALSVGHELTHNTLSSLLVHPISRLRVLATKLGVLIPAVIALGLLGNWLFQGDLRGGVVIRALLVWGPVLAGIGLVPLLTVLTRQPLGGVVFAIAIPGIVLTVSQRFYAHGDPTLALTMTWYGTLAASAIGLVALFVLFRRLEVAGNGGARVQASSAAQAADSPLVDDRPTVRRPWAWLLIKKELRLQQMTFAVSALYVLGAGALLLSESLQKYGGPTFAAASLLHAYCVPLIAGALASAEERHIGTLAAQLLQPRHLRLQWAIKVAVTIGVTLALAIGLPMVLMAVHPPVDPFRITVDLALGLALLAAAATYISSINSNSLWALLSCFPLAGVGIVIGGAGYRMLRYDVSVWVSNWFLGPRTTVRFADWRLLHQDEAVWRAVFKPIQAASKDISTSLSIIETSLIVAFGLLILYFAARNHRRLDRSLRTVSYQLLAMLLFAATAFTAYEVLERIAWRSLPY